MNAETMNNTDPAIKTAPWVDVVWYLSDPNFLNLEMLDKLHGIFGTVTIASTQQKPDMLDQSIKWAQYTEEDTRSSVWNNLLRNGNNKPKEYQFQT